jgi:hypothetical protein
MTDGHPYKVALVWRGDPGGAPGFGRFGALAAALAQRGMQAEACLYDEADEETFRRRLMACDAALVWVNPIQDGRRRDRLNAILREAAQAGAIVSAHPDVIDRMGVKAVLARTRELGWSGDAWFYPTPQSMAAAFPHRVAAGPRVLKQNRGNGGLGVWKVSAMGGGDVEVLEATGDTARTLPLQAFLAERQAELDAAGGFVDQAFQPRLTDGMIRCYMSGERLAGFGWQKVRALAPPDAQSGPRSYSGPDDPRFQRIRGMMEREWAPGLCRLLSIPAAELPMLWDADFMFGPQDAAGDDTYVLCEINVSSVHPFPDEAPGAIAATLATALSSRRERSGAAALRRGG